MIKSVCDWQLANRAEYWVSPSGEKRMITNNGWIRGAFFIGVMATWRVTNEEKYFEAALQWANENQWLPGPRPRHADDHCVCQTYTDLYFIMKDPNMIGPTQKSFQRMISDPRLGREDWSWSDSLFMAPPVLAQLSLATGQRKYLDFMNKMWWDSTDFLYDEERNLFYRDETFRIEEDSPGPREKNGQKIFWSRGNGWVMGGIVRLLKYMSGDYMDREKYIHLLKQMAESIAPLQPQDGLWRSSLLDPEAYPAPETSGSSFFCYALTWGINRGILEKAKYLPVVDKAWAGLVKAVDEHGKLGWVQLPGKGPAQVSPNDTMEYGTGAFLLAGSEIAKRRGQVFILDNMKNRCQE